MITIREIIVNAPPVADVSYWSVCIFLKKSQDFSIDQHVKILFINMAINQIN